MGDRNAHLEQAEGEEWADLRDQLLGMGMTLDEWDGMLKKWREEFHHTLFTDETGQLRCAMHLTKGMLWDLRDEVARRSQQ